MLMNIKDINEVAIIGGGPGGLMLGLLLQQRDIPFTIYEKGTQDVNADRGGSLDIHDDSGQLALQQAGIQEDFHQLARFDGEDTKVVGKDGTVYYTEVVDEDELGGRPEIDRGELCDLILQQIDDTHIRYHYQFESMETLDDGRCRVHFTNGETTEADLVVGVDGAFSKVRPYLSSQEIEYTGISMVELNVEDVEHEHSELLAYNQRGKMMALVGNRALLAQLNGDGRIKVYVSYRMEKETMDDYKAMSIADLKAQVEQDFADWAPELQRYITEAGNEILLRRIYRLPIGFKWETQGNVTLLGDAAHLMSPFAGEGVNAALYDAYLFDQALAKADELNAVVRQYEYAMYAASAQSAQESQDNLELMFSKGAAEKMGDFFKSVLDDTED